jgi:(E)-4-hydroxy-3-methylbut-2-enyl-diphosphate synthase
MIQRFKTRDVKVGNISVGGNNPVRVQSMANTNTLDTEATVSQAVKLYKSGCELVRITAPGAKEAEHLAVIKDKIIGKGYEIPLIADIHFNPKAAEIAAGIVEKVRINPGNYTDRNTGKTNFSKIEYVESIGRVRQRIRPLIEICKQNNTALRIGSNHGSLSERIVDRYGDTPLGMVEAALEFARICREMDFHNLVLSMKASNVRIMIYATRLLVKKMKEEGMDVFTSNNMYTLKK